MWNPVGVSWLDLRWDLSCSELFTAQAPFHALYEEKRLGCETQKGQYGKRGGWEGDNKMGYGRNGGTGESTVGGRNGGRGRRT